MDVFQGLPSNSVPLCLTSWKNQKKSVKTSVQINPRTTAKDLVKMLEETGTKVSISTVKRVLYRHNLKGRSARKKPLLQNRYKKSQTTVCNCTWGRRLYFLETTKNI